MNSPPKKGAIWKGMLGGMLGGTGFVISGERDQKLEVVAIGGEGYV